MDNALYEANNVLRNKLEEAEKALARRDHRDRLAQQVAKIGYWDFKPSTGDLYWSPEVMELISGIPSQEMATTYEDFLKFVYKEDQEECHRIITDAIQTGSPFAVEYRVVHKDGSIHWIYGWGGTTERKPAELRMMGAIMDITERKLMENSFRQKNKELQNALNEIKTLKGIIPICTKCKKIRDGEGYWTQVEKYIQEHSDAQFSHGICEVCADELYRGEDWYEESEDESL